MYYLILLNCKEAVSIMNGLLQLISFLKLHLRHKTTAWAQLNS